MLIHELKEFSGYISPDVFTKLWVEPYYMAPRFLFLFTVFNLPGFPASLKVVYILRRAFGCSISLIIFVGFLLVFVLLLCWDGLNWYVRRGACFRV